MNYNPGLPVTEANAPPTRLLGASGYGAVNPTYVVAGTGYGGYATPTDLIAIAGSPSKTVLITNLYVQANATAGTLVGLSFVKRSTANSGGSPTNPAAIPYDSANPAASATVSLYGAAPSLGTLLGSVYVLTITAPATTSAGSSAALFVGNQRDSARLAVDLRQAITLRGPSEMLALNFGGAALPAGFTMSYFVEWVEV